VALVVETLRFSLCTPHLCSLRGMQYFQNAVALITGASSGLGAEFARQLAPHAAALLLVARRADRLKELEREVARPGLTIHCISADLASDTALESLLQKVEASGANVSLLVNNAGVGDHGDFENSEWSRVEAMLDVNIKGLTRLTHALLPSLIRSGRGAVLNVSSIASLIPVPKMAVYAATKAYVTSFSEAIRMETRGTGVSVTALCPGPVETEFFRIAERGGKEKPMATPEFIRVRAEQVVREALSGVARDHARVIPGLLVSITMLFAAFIPMFLLRVLLAAGRGSRRS
jgi:hypothetical protein